MAWQNYTFVENNITMALFHIYTPQDQQIVEQLSACDLYLIGGTAIDFWSEKLSIPKVRERSDNDLDFYTSANNINIENIVNYLNRNNFNVVRSDYMITALNRDKTIEVDILIDYGNVNESLFARDSGIAVMSPVYLFTSKFDRFSRTTDSVRHRTDHIDLIQLLRIIETLDLVSELEQLLSRQNYDNIAEERLNALIDEL